MSRASQLLESLTQYVNNGNTYVPVGSTKPVLENGVYEIVSTMQGLQFVKTEIKTDSLIKLNKSRYNNIMEEIDKFWEKDSDFADLGVMNKRAFILHSIPGTGKSCIIKQIMNKMTENNNITFIARDAGLLVAGMKLFREVEPNRKALVILEEVDEMVQYGSGSKALADLLDGPDSVNNVFYIGTTNYLQNIPERLLRPSRFDRKIEVLPPSKEDRYDYFEAKIGKRVDKETLKMYADVTENFTFAHLKEFLVSVVCLGNSVEETVARLTTKGNASTGREELKYGYASEALFEEALKQNSMNEGVSVIIKKVMADSTKNAPKKLQTMNEAGETADFGFAGATNPPMNPNQHQDVDQEHPEPTHGDMKIELSSGLHYLLGVEEEEAHDWLEKIASQSDVVANPELTVFRISPEGAEEFRDALLGRLKDHPQARVWVDGELTIGTAPEVHEPEEEDEIETEHSGDDDLEGSDDVDVMRDQEMEIETSPEEPDLEDYDNPASSAAPGIGLGGVIQDADEKPMPSNNPVPYMAGDRDDVEFDNEMHWREYVKQHFPNAMITIEDGTGKTVGQKGDITAHTGADMQKDVVGTFSPDDQYGWALAQLQEEDPENEAAARIGTVRKRKSGRFQKTSQGWKKIGEDKKSLESEYTKLARERRQFRIDVNSGKIKMDPQDYIDKLRDMDNKLNDLHFEIQQADESVSPKVSELLSLVHVCESDSEKWVYSMISDSDWNEIGSELSIKDYVKEYDVDLNDVVNSFNDLQTGKTLKGGIPEVTIKSKGSGKWSVVTDGRQIQLKDGQVLALLISFAAENGNPSNYIHEGHVKEWIMDLNDAVNALLGREITINMVLAGELMKDGLSIEAAAKQYVKEMDKYESSPSRQQMVDDILSKIEDLKGSPDHTDEIENIKDMLGIEHDSDMDRREEPDLESMLQDATDSQIVEIYNHYVTDEAMPPHSTMSPDSLRNELEKYIVDADLDWLMDNDSIVDFGKMFLDTVKAAKKGKEQAAQLGDVKVSSKNGKMFVTVDGHKNKIEWK